MSPQLTVTGELKTLLRRVKLGRCLDTLPERTKTTRRRHTEMNLNEWLRAIAGFFVILSVVLAVTVDQRFLWFTGFVGLNLLQSAFTRWCPMITILKKIGIREA